MNDRGGQSQPNEGVDFESALTSTPDISLHCASDAKGQNQTHALQQSRGGFEVCGQACNSSSKALASFRSIVSKPSVNQP